MDRTFGRVMGRQRTADAVKVRGQWSVSSWSTLLEIGPCWVSMTMIVLKLSSIYY